MPRTPLVAITVFAAALVGCGEDDPVSAPAAPAVRNHFVITKTYAGEGATFEYPGDWMVGHSIGPDGRTQTDIRPRDRSKTPYGRIVLRVSRRDRLRRAGMAIDVKGATHARRVSKVMPRGDGSDPVQIAWERLEVRRRDGSVLELEVEGPLRDSEERVVPKLVLETLELTGA